MQLILGAFCSSAVELNVAREPFERGQKDEAKEQRGLSLCYDDDGRSGDDETEHSFRNSGATRLILLPRYPMDTQSITDEQALL